MQLDEKRRRRDRKEGRQRERAKDIKGEGGNVERTLHIDKPLPVLYDAYFLLSVALFLFRSSKSSWNSVQQKDAPAKII